MGAVGLDRGRAGFPDDKALQDDQAQRRDQAGADNPDADVNVGQGLGKQQALHRLEGEGQRRAGQEGGLGEPGHRLGLAVAEAVVAVRGARGIGNPQQCDQRGSRIHQRVDRRGQQGDRIGLQPRAQLDHDQHDGQRQAAPAGQLAQGAVFDRGFRMRHVRQFGREGRIVKGKRVGTVFA